MAPERNFESWLPKFVMELVAILWVLEYHPDVHFRFDWNPVQSCRLVAPLRHGLSSQLGQDGIAPDHFDVFETAARFDDCFDQHLSLELEPQCQWRNDGGRTTDQTGDFRLATQPLCWRRRLFWLSRWRRRGRWRKHL